MIKYQSKDIQGCYESDPSFRRKADEDEQKYRTLLNKANQAAPTSTLDENILEQFPYLQDCELYFWYGHLQPPPAQQSCKLTLHFLRLFQPKLERPFVFVFFNQGTDSSEYFFQFKNLFLLLPLSILQHMRQFIIVKASRFIKLASFVGSVSRVLAAESYQTYHNCKQLCDKLNIPPAQFIQFVPELISKEMPEAARKKKHSLTTFRLNLQGQTRTEHQRKQKHQFQLSIAAFIEKELYTIDQFRLSQLGIPLILQHLISYFQNQPQTLQLQGIFRKSVAMDEQDQILTHLRTGNYDCLKEVDNPYMIACLLKRFFYNLKEPVVPYPHYNVMLADPSLQHIKAVLHTLPKVNYLSLLFLLQFLSKEVMPREERNKMNAYNLAVCFSQALMRSEVPSEASIANAKATVNIACLMLSNFQVIFGDDATRSNLFSGHLIGKNQQFEDIIQQQLHIDIHDRLSVQQINQALHADQPFHPQQSTHQHKITQNHNITYQHNINYQHKIEQQHKIAQQNKIQQKQNVKQQGTIQQQDMMQQEARMMVQPNAPPVQHPLYHTPNKTKVQIQSQNLHPQACTNTQFKDNLQPGWQSSEKSPLAKRMEEINSELKSIEDRFKSRKKSMALQKTQYKSIILEGDDAFVQTNAGQQPYEWKRANTQQYWQTVEERLKGDRQNRK